MKMHKQFVLIAFVTKRIGNKIVQYDIKTGEQTSTLFDGDNMSDIDIKIDGYTLSDDESKILIAVDRESIYRRSAKAYYYIYDRNKASLHSVFDDDKVLSATFSPDGNKVGYAWQNNLYLLDINTGETSAMTFDGKKNEIINGICDWVYEEEFSFTKAFFWSPDSRRIAYIRFDESAVKEFTMTNYKGGLYPEYETFKYPKVGEANAKVSVHVYDVESEESTEIQIGDLTDMYIPRIKWTKDPNHLCVFKMNRHQNHLQLYNVDVENAAAEIILDEKNKYYIDVTDDLTFLDNGKQFIWSSEESGYNHLYLYNINGDKVRALTKGGYDVTSFYGVDEKRNRIYFQTAQKSPMERHVYEANLNGGEIKNLTNKSGTNSAQFSSTYDFYTWTNSDINNPATYGIYNRKGRLVRNLEENESMRAVTNQEAQPAEFFNFKTSEGVDLNGYMIKPADFNTDNEHPVLMYVYGGPASQTVRDSWQGQNYWWFQSLAQKGYIIVSVDGRGTGARGEEFRKMTYLTLGKFETIDLIESAKYLGGLSYIDADRIGIFGWSYGGFMASHAILQGNDVFDTAIAVAPVTNWKWYDTIYTERFMRTDDENPDGYEDNSPITYADRLKGSYLLVHGNSDDNVHFQNSAEMAAALIKANKQFDTYFYPNRNHGIRGDNARLHLYTKMTDFILENL